MTHTKRLIAKEKELKLTKKHLTSPPRMEGKVKNARMNSKRKKHTKKAT